ncbi:MAG: hypothetical protein MUQ32_14775 [Chloroflexi bacterium]|nr:hypothetical protein [Chloroflexota bacterium]
MSTRGARVPPMPAASARPALAPTEPVHRRLRRSVRLRWTQLRTVRLPRPERRAVAQALLLLALAGVVAAGALGIFVGRGESESRAAVGDVVSIPGGQMRVDVIRPWDENKHDGGMPGMKIPDPKPTDARRFWLDVTLGARAAPGIRHDPRLFTISGEGMAPREPHGASEGLGVIVPGAQATVTLLYQVPKKVGDVSLSVPGVSRPVVIPAPGSTAETDDHDH